MGIRGAAGVGEGGLNHCFHFGLKEVHKFPGFGAVQQNERTCGATGIDFDVTVIKKKADYTLLKTDPSNGTIGSRNDSVQGEPTFDGDVMRGKSVAGSNLPKVVVDRRGNGDPNQSPLRPK